VIEAGRKVNFTGLHNLAKHAIYLSENCDSALATLQCFRDFHETTFECSLDPSQKRIPNSSQKAVRQALDYHKTLFESTKRRLSSLDKRMTNILELSFHLVTLRDSRTMQSESKSMKTIAIMTLFFMPLGTIAAVFGTEFFNTRDDDPVHIRVSQDFWILWLVVGPLTIFVVVVWLVWYWDARAKLGFDVWHKGESVYLGWKRLKGRFRYQGFQIKGRGMQDDERIEMRSMS
jgi:Mg2+ and Co2+ transporter CorA